MSGPAKLSDRVEQLTGTLVEIKHVIQQFESLQQKMLGALVDLVEINDPRIDEVLLKFDINLHRDGRQIFPRPPQYPQVIQIDPNRRNN